MQIECPACKQKLSAPDSAEGRRFRCPKCKNIFSVQPPPPVMPAPPVPKPCPNCGDPLDPDAIICHRCGLNLETGRTPGDDEEEAIEGKGEGVPRFEPGIVMEYIRAYLPGLFQPGILIRAICCAIVGHFLLAGCVFMTALAMSFGAVVFEAAIGGAGGLIFNGQAIAMLITGERGFAHELLADMNGGQWLLFLVLLFGPLFGEYFAARAAWPLLSAYLKARGYLPN